MENFWNAVNHCEITLILTLLEDFLIFSATGKTNFKITGTKRYVPVITLSIQDNAKLLQQLKSGCKRSINCNKYQAKVSTEGLNQYFDILIDLNFQGANRIFVLSFENGGNRKVYIGSYLPKVEVKDYNLMIDEKSCLISWLKMILEHFNWSRRWLYNRLFARL